MIGLAHAGLIIEQTAVRGDEEGLLPPAHDLATVAIFKKSCFFAAEGTRKRALLDGILLI